MNDRKRLGVHILYKCVCNLSFKCSAEYRIQKGANVSTNVFTIYSTLSSYSSLTHWIALDNVEIFKDGKMKQTYATVMFYVCKIVIFFVYTVLWSGSETTVN